jgi:hypothetical protein
MKSDYRGMIFCVMLMVVVPVLYAMGDWWGGTLPAIGLPFAAAMVTFLYLASGRDEPPSGPPDGMQPPVVPPTGG